MEKTNGRPLSVRPGYPSAMWIWRRWLAFRRFARRNPMSRGHGSTVRSQSRTLKFSNLRTRQESGSAASRAATSWVGRRRKSPADITAFLSDFGRGEKHSEGESRRAIELLADVLGSFRVGLAEVTDVNAELSGDDKSTLGTVNIDRMAYTAASASAPADMRVDGFALDSPEGRISVASTSLTASLWNPRSRV